jgi:hypothetical protein
VTRQYFRIGWAPSLDLLVAPCVFDGPIKGECFAAYVAKQLVLVHHKVSALAIPEHAVIQRRWALPMKWLNAEYGGLGKAFLKNTKL